MVLQSILQYRRFAASQHVQRYADVHPSLSRVEEKSRPPVPPPGPVQQPSFAPSGMTHYSDAPSAITNWSGLVTAPQTPMPMEEGGGREVGLTNSTEEATSPTLSPTPNDEEESSSPLGTNKQEKEARDRVEEEHSRFLVDWDEGEAENPQNWSWTKKWCLIGMVTSLALLVGAAASIDSAANTQAQAAFGVGSEVMNLQTAVFLIGFGVASPFMGSLSELGGRNPVYAVTLTLFVLFEIGCALSKNIQTRVILRFFAGVFGATPLSNAGGSMADIVNARERTYVFPIVSW
jgi:hypothetical protein